MIDENSQNLDEQSSNHFSNQYSDESLDNQNEESLDDEISEKIKENKQIQSNQNIVESIKNQNTQDETQYDEVESSYKQIILRFIIILLILIPIFFGYIYLVPKFKIENMASHQKNKILYNDQIYVPQPLGEDREFYSFEIKNLNVLVINPQNQSQISSIGISVNKGTQNDPFDSIGMNQIISSTILQGSQKFKNSDYLKKILDKYNGYGKNVVEDFTTSYYYQFQQDGLLQIIDFFADSLINPLFNITQIQQAITQHNEKIQKQKDTKNRQREILKKFVNSESRVQLDGNQPITFTEGNESAQKKIQQYHQQFYTGQNLSLVIISNLSYELIKDQIKKSFINLNQKQMSDINEDSKNDQKQEKTQNIFNELNQPFKSDYKGMYFYLENDSIDSSLTLYFTIQSQSRESLFQPQKYFEYLVKRQEPSSLKQLGQNQKLFNDINCYTIFKNQNFEVFAISFLKLQKPEKKVNLNQNDKDYRILGEDDSSDNKNKLINIPYIPEYINFELEQEKISKQIQKDLPKQLPPLPPPPPFILLPPTPPAKLSLKDLNEKKILRDKKFKQEQNEFLLKQFEEWQQKKKKQQQQQNQELLIQQEKIIKNDLNENITINDFQDLEELQENDFQIEKILSLLTQFIKSISNNPDIISAFKTIKKFKEINFLIDNENSILSESFFPQNIIHQSFEFSKFILNNSQYQLLSHYNVYQQFDQSVWEKFLLGINMENSILFLESDILNDIKDENLNDQDNSVGSVQKDDQSVVFDELYLHNLINLKRFMFELDHKNRSQLSMKKYFEIIQEDFKSEKEGIFENKKLLSIYKKFDKLKILDENKNIPDVIEDYFNTYIQYEEKQNKKNPSKQSYNEFSFSVKYFEKINKIKFHFQEDDKTNFYLMMIPLYVTQNFGNKQQNLESIDQKIKTPIIQDYFYMVQPQQCLIFPEKYKLDFNQNNYTQQQNKITEKGLNLNTISKRLLLNSESLIFQKNKIKKPTLLPYFNCLKNYYEKEDKVIQPIQLFSSKQIRIYFQNFRIHLQNRIIIQMIFNYQTLDEQIQNPLDIQKQKINQILLNAFCYVMNKLIFNNYFDIMINGNEIYCSYLDKKLILNFSGYDQNYSMYLVNYLKIYFNQDLTQKRSEIKDLISQFYIEHKDQFISNQIQTFDNSTMSFKKDVIKNQVKYENVISNLEILKKKLIQNLNLDIIIIGNIRKDELLHTNKKIIKFFSNKNEVDYYEELIDIRNEEIKQLILTHKITKNDANQIYKVETNIKQTTNAQYVYATYFHIVNTKESDLTKILFLKFFREWLKIKIKQQFSDFNKFNENFQSYYFFDGIFIILDSNYFFENEVQVGIQNLIKEFQTWFDEKSDLEILIKANEIQINSQKLKGFIDLFSSYITNKFSQEEMKIISNLNEQSFDNYIPQTTKDFVKNSIVGNQQRMIFQIQNTSLMPNILENYLQNNIKINQDVKKNDILLVQQFIINQNQLEIHF